MKANTSNNNSEEPKRKQSRSLSD
jgi:hypothetical protein